MVVPATEANDPVVVTDATGEAFDELVLEMLSPLAGLGFRRIVTPAPDAVVLAATSVAIVVARSEAGVIRLELGDPRDLFVDDEAPRPIVSLAPSVSGFRVLALAGVPAASGDLAPFADAVRAHLALSPDDVVGAHDGSAYFRAVAEEEEAMDRARAEAEAIERDALVSEHAVRGIRVRELVTTDALWANLEAMVPGSRPAHVFVVALPIGNAVTMTRADADALAASWDEPDA